MKRRLQFALVVLVTMLPLMWNGFTMKAQNPVSFYDKPLGMRFEILDEQKKEVALVPRKPGDNTVGRRYAGQFVLPETVTYNKQVYTVVEIGDKAFQSATELRAIEFNESLRKIGDYAFDGCGKLEMNELVIGGKITSIGFESFNGCAKIKKFVLGKQLEKIGNSSFSRNPGAVVLEEGNPNFVMENGMLFVKDKSELVYTSPFIETVNFPKELRVIRPYSMHSLQRIESIDVPEGVVAIGDRAMDMANVLKHVSLPASLAEFGKSVLSGDTELETIKVADGNKNFIVKDGCLYSKDLTILIKCPVAKKWDSEKFVIPNGVKRIDDGCFSNAGFKSYTFPETLEEIGDAGFFFNESITEVRLPSIKKIGSMAFLGCSQIKQVLLGSKCETLGRSCFSFCENLLIFQVLAQTPPKHEETFVGLFPSNLEEDGTLYVPIGKKDVYKDSKTGGDFAAIAKIIETDKIMLNSENVLNKASFSVCGGKGSATIATSDRTDFELYDMAGSLIWRGTVCGEINIPLIKGIYILTSQNGATKVVVL